jgi:hypothetical protein
LLDPQQLAKLLQNQHSRSVAVPPGAPIGEPDGFPDGG